MASEPGRVTGFVLVVAAVAAVAGILFGFDTGVISGAILFISEEFSLTGIITEVAVSAVLMGAIIGALFGGPLSDRVGRRSSILAASLIFLAGTVVVVLSPIFSIFLVGRILIGIAIGVASFVAPLYISEIAPEHIRGALVSLNQLLITVGILIAYGVNYYFAAAGDWRAMFLAGVMQPSSERSAAPRMSRTSSGRSRGACSLKGRGRCRTWSRPLSGSRCFWVWASRSSSRRPGSTPSSTTLRPSSSLPALRRRPPRSPRRSGSAS
ncbi:MAG: MFS transporter [Methanoculleus sp.]|nr:MFS transporter [Methanoculleus sp.]MDD2788758.1 MFS transporter [Methanoculleus sp.]